MGSIFKGPKAPEVAPPPPTPDQTDMERRAELAAEALRMRRGRAANVYAGETQQGTTSAGKMLLGQ
jgi:hypothetical protein